jgi:hypothetical protein
MSAAREKDQADFDLERFIDMFDTALTSNDPRVVETLRRLLMIVTLTRPETAGHAIDRQQGPLRRLYEDVNHLNRRLHRMEDELRQVRNPYLNDARHPYEKYAAQAAKEMSDEIDQNLLNTIKAKGLFYK